ncbi:hypothetical protein H5410_026591 [Solanum commersonii]|uniref:Ubiquitin-like protease family profile domain-containing protein n=1 Tax=Solanum commersonii TaxID=4109 RepID=A0A9J5YWK2_SOLCO|nr:hypothetical protein H5410_026591 [Solanum commersonii]
MYLNGRFNYQDLVSMTDPYFLFECKYNNLREKSLVDGAPPMHEALTSFEMDGDILKYCKGEMPFPYGRKWNRAKRIYTVMNIKNTHFIALEFLMENGLIQVYDCNIHMCDEPTFLTLIQPILELWPKLLKQSGMFNHLSKFFLNDAWSYERLKNVPSNNSRAACGPYACVFIDHLLLGDGYGIYDNEYFVFLLSTTLIVSTTASIVLVSASVVRTTGSIVPTTISVVCTTGSIVSTTSLVVPATGLVVTPIL